MLRARRNSNLAGSLGPPMRFSDVDESMVDEKSVQQPQSSRRPPLSSATRGSHGKENRFQAGTPRERPLTVNSRQTPNSTYPTSKCSSSGRPKKSFNFVGAPPPSSTFAVSLSATGFPSSQDTPLTKPNTPLASEAQNNSIQTNEEKVRVIARDQSTVEVARHCETNTYDGVVDTREEQLLHNRDSQQLPTSSSHQSLVHKSKSVPQHLEAVMSQNSIGAAEDGHLASHKGLLPSKMNPEQSSVRRASEDRGIPAPLPSMAVNSQTVKAGSEVVTLSSAAGEKRFQRLKLLGCGGSSKVYKVVGEDFQTYALKEVYLRHVDPAIKSAYINEIKLLKKLTDKPEIITLHYYTFNKQDVVLYLLLEYAEMDLNAVLKSHTTGNRMAMVLFFWNQMLEAVKVIHNEGVIHNDLKPENFVCIGARLKLIDFGIANRIETEKTSIERDIRCGTINYMAPETIEANDDLDCFKVGRPSDIWSLGCILYQMIYGRTPFQHIKNKLKKWQAIVDPSIAIPFPDIDSAAAVDVMTRCLCRNPKERPTINELLTHPFSTMKHQ